MSQDTDRYLHFNVGLLKDSFALDALWQDALKYHMIDQPEKLIALRLTEYYEMASKGVIQMGSGASNRMPLPAPTPTSVSNNESHELSAASFYTESEQFSEHTSPPGGHIVTASPDVEQNADEAAEYWALL